MAETLPQPTASPEERNWLTRFLTWHIAFIGILAAQTVALYILHPHPRLVIALACVSCSAVLFAWARRLVQRGQTGSAAIVISATLMIGGPLVALAVPDGALVLTVYPLVALAFATPLLGERSFRWLLVAAVASVTTVVVLGMVLPPIFAAIPLSNLFTIISSVISLLLLLALMHWQRLRQLHLVDELRTMRDSLAEQVEKQTEQLRASAARYREIADLTSDYIYELAVLPDGSVRIEWATDALERISGYAIDEIEAHGGLDALIHPQDQALVAQSRALMFQGQEYTCEFRIITRSGEVRWLRDYAFPRWDEPSARIVAIIGATRDVTAPRLVEEDLRRSEALYRDVVEHAVAGVFRTSSKGHYVTINPALARLYGYESPAHMLRQVTDVTTQLYADPQQRAELLALLEANEFVTGFETQVRHRDGHTLWVSQSVRRICDSDGKLAFYEGFVEDITSRKLAELALRESEARFRMVADHIDEVFWLTNREGSELYYVSPAYERMYGHSCDDLYANPASFFDWVHPEDRARLHELLPDYRDRTLEVEHRVLHTDGSVRWVWVHTKPIVDEQGTVVRRVGVAKDITQRKAYEAQIEHLAYYDALTDLPNRRMLHRYLLPQIELVNNEEAMLALLYLDLDRFKAVNDSLGHDAGDALLIQVANRLRENLFDTTLLARLGGDEFAIVLPDTSEAEAVGVAHDLLRAIERPFQLHGHSLRLGGSFGVACAPRHSREVGTLLKYADIAMYRAKTYREGCRVFDPAWIGQIEERLLLENELQRAIETSELQLHYQPLYERNSSRITCAEALVRWPHPERGTLPPHAFIPLAEESTLIRALDRWVVATAMQQSADWLREGYQLPVWMNLSPQSLDDRALVTFVRRCLHETGAHPDLLTMEITESAVARNPEALHQVIRGLRELGIRVALDDFGNGYTALTQLKHLPLDVLKIDRSFTKGIGSDLGDEGIIEAMITLGHGFGMKVVVEGVETEEQRAWLEQTGCDLLQGYLLGKPMQPATLLTLADNHQLDQSQQTQQAQQLKMHTLPQERGH